MTTVTGFTAERMLAMEAATIVDGDVVGDNLILTRHDSTTIDAGNVRGPTGSPGVTEAELEDQVLDSMPVNSVIDYLGVAPPNAKWLAMAGQTIVNGQTLYPAFWAKIPAGMKSGANIIMPNAGGRVSAGYDPTQTEFDTLLEAGGAKTHTLTTAEIASHNHTQNAHAHTGSSGNQSADHMHWTLASSINLPHYHYAEGGPASGKQYIVQTAGGSAGLNLTTPGATVTSASATGLPTAPMNFPALATDGASQNHTHSVTVNQQTATNNAAGGGGAHNNLQPYITLLKIVKVA
jgi:microcystin-dependent protein